MSTAADNLTAVILAGGKNLRFGGSDKAFMLVDGIPMIKVLTGKVEGLFSEILVATNSPEKYAELAGVVPVTDVFKGMGPLGGIHAAMKMASNPGIFVVSCDMPFVDKDVIGAIARKYEKTPDADAVIPVLGGYTEPLHAIYRTSLAEYLEKYLASSPDLSVRNFISGLKAVYIDMPDTENVRRSFTNINRPDDLPASG